MAREAATAEEYAEITFDLRTLTMGEAAQAEMASGEPIQKLLRPGMSLRLLAMFVHELRNSAEPRSWSELSNLRLLDVTSSISAARPDGPPARSSD